MRQTFTTSGKASLATFEWGAGSSHVVALHPGVADSRAWERCAPTWADSGIHVVAHDRRGFGETKYEEELHDEVDDLVAVMDATGVDSAVVVGNSMGGLLALDLAFAHPDRVDALVLIAPAMSGYPPENWHVSEAEAAQDELIATAEVAEDHELVNELELRYWLDGTEQPEGRVSGPPRDLMSEMNLGALRSGPAGESVRRPGVWPRLAELQIPTLVIVGAYDLPGQVQLCRELAGAVSGAELLVMENSAHCPSLDAPDQLNELVLRFVR